ncbi:hypothetical protein [Chryseobacterium nematophagum]|nr:hypothetical protein [Chryseobacterium nematophagum]
MKKFLLFVLFFFLMVCNGQKKKTLCDQSELIERIHLLDSYMQNNDAKIVDLLCAEVSFGHSNGWVQRLNNFKEDFTSQKIRYNKIIQTEISECKEYKKVVSIRRKVKVSGTYKNQDFEMVLALLEIWRKEKSVWKLWSRQSIKINP